MWRILPKVYTASGHTESITSIRPDTRSDPDALMMGLFNIASSLQGFVFVNSDPAMEDAAGQYAKARNTNLNEDLGKARLLSFLVFVVLPLLVAGLHIWAVLTAGA